MSFSSNQLVANTSRDLPDNSNRVNSLSFEKGESPLLAYRPRDLWARFRLGCYERSGEGASLFRSPLFQRSVEKDIKAFQINVKTFKEKYEETYKNYPAWVEKFAQAPLRKNKLIIAHQRQEHFRSLQQAFIRIRRGNRTVKSSAKIAQALGLMKQSEERVRSLDSKQVKAFDRACQFVRRLAALNLQKGYSPPEAFREVEVPAVSQGQKKEAESQNLDEKLCLESIAVSPQVSTDSLLRLRDSGAFNKVFLVTVQNQSGERVDRVWKPEREPKRNSVHYMGSAASVHLGIDSKNPRYAERNVASSKLAEILDWNVIVRADLATYHGKKGILMDFAEGYPLQFEVKGDFQPSQNPIIQDLEAILQTLPEEERLSFFHDWLVLYDYRPHLFYYKQEEGKIYEIESASDLLYYIQPNLDDSLFQRQLYQLQVLDYLLAQADRHNGNIQVQKTEDGHFSIKGFDNDECLGRNSLKYDCKKGIHVVDPPSLMDQDMKKVLKDSQKKEAFLTYLEEEGFAKEEVQQVRSRWEELVSRLDRQDLKIIATEEWGNPEFKKEGEKKSYLGRIWHYQTHLGREEKVLAYGPELREVATYDCFGFTSFDGPRYKKVLEDSQKKEAFLTYLKGKGFSQKKIEKVKDLWKRYVTSLNSEELKIIEEEQWEELVLTLKLENSHGKKAFLTYLKKEGFSEEIIKAIEDFWDTRFVFFASKILEMIKKEQWGKLVHSWGLT